MKTAEQNNSGLIGSVVDFTNRSQQHAVGSKAPLIDKEIRETLIKYEPSLEYVFALVMGDCDSRDMGQRIVDAVKKLIINDI